MGVENYHVIELVGEGSFGKVYKGRRKFTGQVLMFCVSENLSLFLFGLFGNVMICGLFFQTVAMKFIMKQGKSDKDIHNLRQEIEVLGSSFLVYTSM